MRAMIPLVVLAAAAATPAVAQDPYYDTLRAQQQLAAQRDVALRNELMALEARLRTEQAVSEQQLARVPYRLPEPPYPSPLPPVPIDTSKLPSIPDAALAASNARVKAAAENRR